MDNFVPLDLKRSVDQSKSDRKTAGSARSLTGNSFEIGNKCRVVPGSVSNDKRKRSAIVVFGKKNVSSFLPLKNPFDLSALLRA